MDEKEWKRKKIKSGNEKRMKNGEEKKWGYCRNTSDKIETGWKRMKEKENKKWEWEKNEEI